MKEFDFSTLLATRWSILPDRRSLNKLLFKQMVDVLAISTVQRISPFMFLPSVREFSETQEMADVIVCLFVQVKND